MSRYSGIDLLKLYSGCLPEFKDDTIFATGFNDSESSAAKADITRTSNAFKSHEKWNAWLTLCLDKNNISELISVRSRLQYGMADLAKKKMNTPEIAQMFVRWTGSIEKTVRKIIHKKYPMPKGIDNESLRKWGEQKKKRDAEIEKYLKKTSY